MLTEMETTFSGLKTEFGLRPVCQQKEERVTGHLLITLLAYHLVHNQLKQEGIHLNWDINIMSAQQRMTIILP